MSQLLISHVATMCDSWITFKDLEHIINLNKFECTPGPPAFLLGFSIVYITLVLGGFAHTQQQVPRATRSLIVTEHSTDTADSGKASGLLGCRPVDGKFSADLRKISFLFLAQAESRRCSGMQMPRERLGCSKSSCCNVEHEICRGTRARRGLRGNRLCNHRNAFRKPEAAS